MFLANGCLGSQYFVEPETSQNKRQQGRIIVETRPAIGRTCSIKPQPYKK